MTVAEALTAAGITPAENYSGVEQNDDYILAIQTTSTQSKPSTYVVCADHITGYAASLNPSTSDSTFIRTGTATTKTGTQRVFTVEGERVIGDAFQDYCLSHKIKFGVGKDVETKYVYFSARTGKGEEGVVSIVVNNDADGKAGEPAGVKIDLKAVGCPKEYTYSASA